MHLGTFDTLEEAVEVRSSVEKAMHKEFNGEINRQDFVKIIKKKERI